MKTLPCNGWFCSIRLCGPTPTYFDRSWVLADIEVIE